MRQTLVTLALGIALSTANAGLETLTTNSESRVSPIIQDNRAIESSSSGKIPVSEETCKSLITQVPLLGKLAYLYGFSPFIYGTNSLGEITFSDAKGTMSTLKYIKDSTIEDKIIKEIEIEGTRPYIHNFKAYMRLDCKKNNQEIEYNSTMYIVVENGLRRFILRGAMCLPRYGEVIEGSFKAEQDRVGQMMASLAKEMQTKPEEFLKKAKESKILTGKEEHELEKTMIKNGFLK